MNTKIVLVLCAVCTLLVGKANAQTNVWDLKRCIEYALGKNLNIKQSELTVETAERNVNQSYATLAPTLNGSANNSWNVGRRIDPFTNQFANSSVLSQNFSLSSGVTLFSGFTNVNTVKQTRVLFLAAKFDNEKLRNDIAVNVATAFLQVLFAQENLKVAQTQVDITRNNVERTRKLVDAGALAQGVLLDLEAQLANEELSVVNAANQVDLTTLALVQLLDLTDDEAAGFTIEAKVDDFSISPELTTLSTTTIFNEAAKNFPEIKAADERVKSNLLGYKIAKGAYYPTLTAFAAIGTGYSQLRQTVVGQGNPNIIQIGATQSGESVFTLQPNPIFERTPFGQQYSDNVNRNLGFSLNIPMFNGLQARTNATRAKLNYEGAKINLDITKNTLRRAIEQAYIDTKSALKRYEASKKSVESSTLAFDFAKTRFDAGVINQVDYLTAKNRLLNAESNLLQAKYDYLFRSKILDFYRGKPLY